MAVFLHELLKEFFICFLIERYLDSSSEVGNADRKYNDFYCYWFEPFSLLKGSFYYIPNLVLHRLLGHLVSRAPILRAE